MLGCSLSTQQPLGTITKDSQAQLLSQGELGGPRSSLLSPGSCFCQSSHWASIENVHSAGWCACLLYKDRLDIGTLCQRLSGFRLQAARDSRR